MITAQGLMEEVRVQGEVKRTTLMAALALVCVGVDAFENGIYKAPVPGGLAVGLAVVSLAYVGYSLFVQRSSAASTRAKHRVSQLYWLLFAIALLGFLFLESQSGGFPYKNVSLLFALMVFAPVEHAQEAKKFFMAAIPCVVIVMAIGGASLLSCLKAAGIGVAAALMGYALLSSYHHIIRALRTEGDLDGMTQIYSKTAGVARMSALLSLCRRMNRFVAVYYIDIDHFKSYNDTYGHAKGDEALIKVADCLKRCFTRESDVVCRMGGEEFAVVVPVADANVALSMGKKLSNMILDMRIRSGSQAKFPILTVSIGLQTVNPKSELLPNIERILEDADRQLYVAKSNGRNCIAVNGAVVFRNRMS